MNDDEIIRLFFNRSEQAINALTEKYRPVCMRIAHNILHNESDAEECVNDAFLSLWNSIPPKKPDPLSSYLFRVVRNLALKCLRYNTAQKRNNSYDLVLDELAEILPSKNTAENEFMATELAQEINSFLLRQDTLSRVLFVRRYWFCDSVTALAQDMNLSTNRVSVRLSRTRKKLYSHLKKEGYFYES
ncbi:MAG: sigma-70 family RNA polymerase sigma factor [Clostridia bacterium]|nr:sigma-70 family RNA polymerase sigma factor [Clostridia bacterium]